MNKCGCYPKRLRMDVPLLNKVSTLARLAYGIGLCLAITWSTPAELLVLQPGLGHTTTAALRFKDRNGFFIAPLSADTESFERATEGPDGDVYVTGNTMGYGAVYRFSREGVLRGRFASQNLTIPAGLTFGPDGHLYVAGIAYHETAQGGRILRYDGQTGAFKDAFIPTGAGGLAQPVDLVFTPAGFLLVADRQLGVMRYDAATGAFIDLLIPAGAGGAGELSGLVLGPDSHLYVASGANNAILRYRADTGEWLNVFVGSGSGGLSRPGGLAFGPDRHLYVCSRDSQSVLKYHGKTGDFLEVFIPPQRGGLRVPGALMFTSSPRLQYRRAGTAMEISWPKLFRDYQLMACEHSGGATWTPVSATPVEVGPNWVVTIQPDAKPCFFRLVQK